ncbi:MAG: hypothetical protein L0Y71_06495 [Gemmataceae bacterium]|nr:hypothetical protein [Gemmataceae bacterium]
MKLVDLKDLTPEQLNAFSESRELTPEEKAEVSRLFLAQVSEADLKENLDWDQATSFEEFLAELKDEQRTWDEQRR